MAAGERVIRYLQKLPLDERADPGFRTRRQSRFEK